MNLDSTKLTLATVAYADIFDWPLTPEEVRRWCIGKKLSIVLPQRENFFSLRGRKLIAERRKREIWSRSKWKKAKRAVRLLRLIPSLQLIGATGGLARNNTHRNDDIDLFFITSGGTLWTSRLLVILFAECLGIRRRPNETTVRDKICLNMFMSEDALAIVKNERDLFAAYEVLQMEPLWQREGAYGKFLGKNRWVKKFLPNAWEWRTMGKQLAVIRQNKSFLFSIIEPFARAIQLWYMRRRRTTEVIAPGVLRFHPHDARVWIKQAFGKRLSRYNLPLDKIFYAR